MEKNHLWKLSLQVINDFLKITVYCFSFGSMLLEKFFLFIKFFSKLVNKSFIRTKFMSRITLTLFFHLGTDGKGKQAGSLKASFVFVIWNTSVVCLGGLHGWHVVSKRTAWFAKGRGTLSGWVLLAYSLISSTTSKSLSSPTWHFATKIKMMSLK